MTTKSKPNAAVYARFSSDLQKDRSIDDQKVVCQSVAERDGLKIVSEFSDRAKSGATLLERDGIFDMLAAAKAQKFSVLVVESLDRLSRDQEDLAGLFKRLSFHGVEIRTVNEGTTTPIHVGIRGLVGSLFLADLGQKVRRGQGGLVREGKVPGVVTYGYRKVLGQPGVREIDEAQAEVVRRIFREYASGASPRAIAKGLNADNVPTPNGGRKWSHQVFARGKLRGGIISNPVYAGKITWNKSRTLRNPETGRKIKRLAAAAELLTVDAPHMRIVDQELWDKANAVLVKRSFDKFGEEGPKPRLPYSSSREHVLSGLVRCAVCNGHMRVSTTPGNKAPRITCADAHRGGECSHVKSYDTDILLEGVLDQMRTRLVDPVKVGDIVREFHAEWKKEQAAHRSEADAASKVLARAKAQIDRLVNVITDGGDDIGELKDRLKTLHAERTAAAERLRLAEAQTNVVALHPDVIENYRTEVKVLAEAIADKGVKITQESRAAFRNLFDCIVVHPTPKRKPYEFSLYGRLDSLMSGGDLFPTMEATGKSGKSKYDSGNPAFSVLTESYQSKVIPFGRFKAVAS